MTTVLQSQILVVLRDADDHATLAMLIFAIRVLARSPAEVRSVAGRVRRLEMHTDCASSSSSRDAAIVSVVLSRHCSILVAAAATAAELGQAVAFYIGIKVTVVFQVPNAVLHAVSKLLHQYFHSFIHLVHFRQLGPYKRGYTNYTKTNRTVHKTNRRKSKN